MIDRKQPHIYSEPPQAASVPLVVRVFKPRRPGSPAHVKEWIDGTEVHQEGTRPAT